MIQVVVEHRVCGLGRSEKGRSGGPPRRSSIKTEPPLTGKQNESNNQGWGSDSAKWAKQKDLMRAL